ncbi:MAG TPA: hypothetical protein VF637_08580 [Sphingomicrobium sp.]
MTKFTLILNAIGAGSLSLAMPAVAAPVEPAATTSQRDALRANNARSDKLYCTIHRHTGSQINRKMCATREQWIERQGIDPLAAR